MTGKIINANTAPQKLNGTPLKSQKCSITPTHSSKYPSTPIPSRVNSYKFEEKTPISQKKNNINNDIISTNDQR